MLKFQLGRTSPSSVRKREIKYAEKTLKQFPNTKSVFDYGLEHLFLKDKNPMKCLNKFVDSWWKNPDKKLNFKNFESSEIVEKNGLVKFPSLLNKKEEARFIYCKQPRWRSGSKVAIIMLKHWNADTFKYVRGINFIRRFLLPISTGLFIPSYQNLNPRTDGVRQEQVLGANIGLTIRRTWQDVLDLQYFSKWLKEEQGFDEVGLFTYSIGSLRGILAAMFAPDIFDFGVFHYISDDYTESFVDGIATRPESAITMKNISRKDLQRIWSIISPGNYEKYFHRLSRKNKNGGFRIVQAKYDLVFGEQNVERFTQKIKKRASDIEIMKGNFGHTTMAEVENAVSVMLKDLKFIYKHSTLKYF